MKSLRLICKSHLHLLSFFIAFGSITLLSCDLYGMNIKNKTGKDLNGIYLTISLTPKGKTVATKYPDITLSTENIKDSKTATNSSKENLWSYMSSLSYMSQLSETDSISIVIKAYPYTGEGFSPSSPTGAPWTFVGRTALKTWAQGITNLTF